MSWIAEEIRERGGAVSFDSFMEMALYHPVHGYYSGQNPRYGRGGDFLTAPTASEWYSRIMARVLRELAESLGPMTAVDLAAGDGSFLAGLLEGLGPAAHRVVSEVVAVERSNAMRLRMEGLIADAPMVCLADVSELPSMRRPVVMHASELYDAVPVARAVGRGGGVRELWVIVENDVIGWSERPARDGVAEYFHRREVVLEEGQIAEVSLRSTKLHSEALEKVGNDGLMLVLDYGYETARLYDPRGRRGGSLATFRRHQVGRDPFESPGEIDLTAHVNWDDLRSAATDAGWREVGLWPLAEFLIRAGLGPELEERGLGMEVEITADVFAARQEVKRLLDPDGMGSDLKVLVQAKGEMVGIANELLAMPTEL